MTATAADLRVRPIPDCAPPRLCSVPDLPAGHGAGARETRGYVQGTLAVDFRGRGEDTYFGPQAASTLDLPEPRAWVAAITQAIIETTAGLRSPTQLLRWMTPELYAVVARRASVAGRRGVRQGRRAMVHSVHLCEPADGVIEASAVVFDVDRVRAVALRLSGVDSRWLVTALQLG